MSAELQQVTNSSNIGVTSRRKLAKCLVSPNVAGPCSTCGNLVEPAHLPLEGLGLFCVRCCPVCSAQEAAA